MVEEAEVVGNNNDLMEMCSPEDNMDKSWTKFRNLLKINLKTGIDQGRLTHSLLVKLRDTMNDINDENKVTEEEKWEQAEDEESKGKLQTIEIELEEIA